MRNFGIAKLLILLSVGMILAGCGRLNSSDAKDDGTFPVSIGSFRRDIIYAEKEKNYFNPKNKDQKYKSKEAKFVDGDDSVVYGIATHQKADDALNELEKQAQYDKNIHWKTVDLKDKSGKNVGKLAICRNSDKSPEVIAGSTNYSLAFNIDNQVHSVALTNSSRKWTPQTTDKFVAFVRALPAAAQLDLAMLDLITSGSSDQVVTDEKIAAISPPVKLASAPYLKGKTVVYTTWQYSSGLSTNQFISDAARQANLMSEVGSIVKIECEKGSKIGEYTIKESGTKIPAFSSVCKVAVIDNTIPAVIAQKTFTNSTILDYTIVKTDKGGNVRSSDKEYTAPRPEKEIVEFLRKLPVK